MVSSPFLMRARPESMENPGGPKMKRLKANLHHSSSLNYWMNEERSKLKRTQVAVSLEGNEFGVQRCDIPGLPRSFTIQVCQEVQRLHSYDSFNQQHMRTKTQGNLKCCVKKLKIIMNCNLLPQQLDSSFSKTPGCSMTANCCSLHSLV